MEFKFTDASEMTSEDWSFAFLPALNMGRDPGTFWIEFFWLTFHMELCWTSQ